MPRPASGLSPKAIGWALLSQVFWVPLLAIDLHDRWQAHQRSVTPPGQRVPESPLARARPFSLDDLLGAARPAQQLAGQAQQVVTGALDQAVNGAGVLLSSAGSGLSSLLDRPLTTSVEAPAAGKPAADATALGMPPLPPPLAGQPLLARMYTRSQLLGGSIGLGDLQEGPMAPLALVERAILSSSGDPLAPLPSLWREPMRLALTRLPGPPQRLATARVVHLPSMRISRSTEVPLALQSDGSVDVLQPPDDPAVLTEIESWSRQQRLPEAGSLVPAVVHLQPLPPDAPGGPAETAAATPLSPWPEVPVAPAASTPMPPPAPQPAAALDQAPQSGVADPAPAAVPVVPPTSPVADLPADALAPTP